MLEKLGSTLADVAAMATTFQTALHAENDTAMNEHSEFKTALESVLNCCAAHQKSLDEAGRTQQELTKSLLSFGPAADTYQAARSNRIQQMIGEQTPTEQRQDEAA